MSSPEPTPDMTFELRFDQIMARAADIGVTVSNSPLIIAPSIAGTYTWLSLRSGVFTPTEPLAMDTRYELTLRSRLELPNGQPANVKLHQTLRTPAFGLTAWLPQRADTNTTSEPEVKLIFNADVKAAAAGDYLEFRDSAGRSLTADVRHGTPEEKPNWWSFENRPSLRTWLQESTRHSNSRGSHHRIESESAYEPTNQVANLLIVTPHASLPLGTGWKLVVKKGLPTQDGRLRLPAPSEVALGDVTPFTVGEPVVQNYIGGKPCIQMAFSKAPAESLTSRWADFITIDPTPDDIEATINGRTITFTGDFKSRTSYTVTVRAGLPAQEPFNLKEHASASVWLPPIPPRLYFSAFSQDQLAGGKRSFPLLAINVPRVRVRAKLLEPQTAIYALRGYAAYFRPWREHQSENEPYREVNYELVPGRTTFEGEFNLTNATDVSTNLDLNWNQILGQRKTGVVFIDAGRMPEENEQIPQLGTQAMIQLTDLGLVWKKAEDGVQIFVFSHSTGQPVEGAAARLLGRENELLREAETDSSGFAHLAADTSADWLAVQKGEDLHVMGLKEHGVNLYSFHLPINNSDEDAAPRRVMLFSDRDLYRPGEVLRLKALVRDWTDTSLTIPLGLTGIVSCVDARRLKFYQTNIAFSAAGSWSSEIALPTGSRGEYVATLRFGTQDYHHEFKVQDFQPSAFEIAMPAKTGWGADEKIEIPVSARYFFGKALSHAQIKWSLEAADSEFKPEGFENFTFSHNEYDYRFGRGPTSFASTGEGLLTTNGFLIAAEIPINPVAPRPRAASLFVEMTDVNQQTLSRRIEFLRHASDFYLGLCQASQVLVAGKDLRLEAAAVRADGKPWPEVVKTHLTLKHIEWQTVRVQGAGRSVRYRSEMLVTNVLADDIELQPISLPEKAGAEITGQELTSLPHLPAGEYLVELEAKDSGGRTVNTTLTFNVASAGSLAWDYQNDFQLVLKPNEPRYTVGQTADLLVQAPFSGTALVTVEREKVLRSFVTRLEGNAPSIRVPIEPGDVPNVFVSVTLVRGSDDCPRKIKAPEYRMGYCQIPVDDPETKLSVSITPSATNYLPAQPIEVAAEIKDAKGAAVSGAEVTLYAVDDGILTITDYGTPDPHAFFYAARPLSVSSSVSLPNLLSEDPQDVHFQNKGYLGGGGGSERVRKNFLACAFWNASLVSGPDGKLNARFIAPDSLTRYRLFAVAHASAKQFGSAYSVLQVSKPLLVEPALPSFANLTDKLQARAIVHNQTAKTGEVVVSLELDGKARVLSSSASVSSSASNSVLSSRISVPPNGSASVEFPLEFIEPGVAKWTWKARFADPSAGNFSDAVQSTLDVGQIAPLLREILTSRTAATETNLLTPANPQILAGSGSITVNIANSHLNELGEAVSQLLHYPYGCVEQTGSSLLPWLVSRDFPALFPLLHRGTNEVEVTIRTGLTRLLTMQTQSGGFGYWPHAREPMLWASAYGGLVLALAQRHGIEVPTAEFSELKKYLSEQLRTMGAANAELSDFPLALYALAVAGNPERAYCEKLYELREKLSPENRALLALAMSESGADEKMCRELLVYRSARRYNYDDFGCPAREKAIRLLAWLSTSRGPDSDRVGRVVFVSNAPREREGSIDTLEADLMTEQRNAHWGTTQGDAWAILALTEYSRVEETALRPAKGEVVWQGQSVPFQLDEVTHCCSLPFALTNAASSPLTLINPSGTRLFTSVTLEARSPVAQQPRQDRGFSIQRTYERLDDDNHPWPLASASAFTSPNQSLRVGDRVLVTLHLGVREPARYVAVDDALPSILEAINPGFKTQSTHGPVPQGRISSEESYWTADFHEIRKDRFLSFAIYVPSGNYTIRYVARVRAVGQVTAPSAKVEEMYHPDRYGLTETQPLASHSFD